MTPPVKNAVPLHVIVLHCGPHLNLFVACVWLYFGAKNV